MTEKEMSRCILNGDTSNKRSVCESEQINEQAMLHKIKQSAEQVEVPESLSPESILKKCRELEQEKTGEKKLWFRNPKLVGGLSAAAVFIICFISLRGMGTGNSAAIADKLSASQMEITMTEGAPEMSEEYEPMEMEEAAEEPMMFDEAADAGAGAEEGYAERKDAGELYTLAGSYDAVYEKLEEVKTNLNTARNGGLIVNDMAEMEDVAFSAGVEELRKENAQASAEEAVKYSETNVQTFGIDESDIVKTDGEYLYLLRGSSVNIVSAGEEMKQVSEVKPETADSTANVCAMYVDGDRLILMVQEYTADLERTESEDVAYYDMFYIDTGRSVSVYTYNISDKEKPVLAGRVTQDGSYVTSRKDGSIVYLFTSQYLLEDYEKDPADAIPEVNARKVSADCIYVGEPGERALLISSLSIYSPETVRDTVMILDEGSEIYMGGDSLYLYRTNYRETMESTQIAKFSLTGGFLNGEAAASVRGVIRDTFAIHEKDNKLRVLTTDMSGADRENCLFLLDENLKVTGELTHIAVGESIYAARYLGDMAYFITYRNTDPLFAADLSDEKNPKLVGELEITGFSEYLHFWGKDKLLGLGYETDPKTGQQEGLKLVMFDMSDPVGLKVLGSLVLQESSYSPALYDYKEILVSPEENLIGFVAESYNKGRIRNYVLYQWEENGFEKILSEKLDGDGYDTANYRGLYIGENFYIAHPEIIRCYNRKDYDLKQTLTFR